MFRGIGCTPWMVVMAVAVVVILARGPIAEAFRGANLPIGRPHHHRRHSASWRPRPTVLRSSSSSPPPIHPEDLPGPDDVTEATIRSLFTLWNYALATGEAKIVAKRYARDAVLMPSISDQPLMDPASIEAYYEEYIRQKPQKKVIEGRIKIGFGWAEDTGVCEIRLGNPPPATKGSRADPTRARKARYSFVYVWEGTQWKILHHHSSIMREDDDHDHESGTPRSSTKPSTTSSTTTRVPQSLLSPTKVEHLFQFFNDALDTGDATAVADRFSQKAILFPFLRKAPGISGDLSTDDLSGAPRMGPRQIEDYFRGFLRGAPRARILERHVALDPDPHRPTAKDVGTVEWTFRKNPPPGGSGGTEDPQRNHQKVLARYCLDYVVEGGQWKIAYFQSSPLPEGWMGLSNAGGDAARDAALEALRSRFARSITEEGVKELCRPWLAAVQARDAERVVGLYTKQQPPAMMLTLSEQPYTTLSSIQDFYRTFLFLRQPEAEILEGSSHVTLPSNHQWCKHMGTMVWTLKKTPTEMEQTPTNESSSNTLTIKERFSFLYVLEDGEWRISHHHASVHPESLHLLAPESAGGRGDAPPSQSAPSFVAGMDTRNLPAEDGDGAVPPPPKKKDPWQ